MEISAQDARRYRLLFSAGTSALWNHTFDDSPCDGYDLARQLYAAMNKFKKGQSFAEAELKLPPCLRCDAMRQETQEDTLCEPPGCGAPKTYVLQAFADEIAHRLKYLCALNYSDQPYSPPLPNKFAGIEGFSGGALSQYLALDAMAKTPLTERLARLIQILWIGDE